MKELSVIIVTYNSEPDIYGCLEALFAHNDIGDALEVIVVDNNSHDYEHMQQELARLYGEHVTVLRNMQNGGYGQGNNIGIKHSSAPIIMIMNPDVRWATGSLRAITERYQKDENLAIVGFRQIINKQGKRGQSFSMLNHYPGLVRLLGGIIAKRLDWFSWKHMYFSGACFCVRKNMFERAGLFDEHIFLYGEENDIHYRIHHACPKAHDKYLHDCIYLHLTENRPTTDKQFAQRVASNEYVMQQQGRASGTYIRSEEQRLKWVKRLFGNA
ncbi:MAG: glycosyltransferase family 2 protein [Paludibacteraceae bacterium]|nr:glycosyltransferase family 2 protein [Paludibacteraceae bacterium]